MLFWLYSCNTTGGHWVGKKNLACQQSSSRGGSATASSSYKRAEGNAPELGLALLVEAVHEAVGLALQRPPQGDAAPAAQLLRVAGKSLHRLRQGDKLGRGETLQ